MNGIQVTPSPEFGDTIPIQENWVMSPNSSIHHIGNLGGAGGRRTLNRRRRSEFDTTDTELAAIAAEAIMGLRRMPNSGYRAPAATGMPMTL